MVASSQAKRVIVVGAGMCGPLMAVYLARRGHRVEIYERRGDPRDASTQKGRSIKMTLAEKGLHALRAVGLVEEVLARTIPLRGRAIHGADGRVTYQLYGNSEREVIHSITRSELNVVLLDHLESFPEVSVRFGVRSVHVDRDRPSVTFEDQESGERFEAEGDVVIGADGAYSAVRRAMQRGDRADYHQEFLAWGYKALTIVPDAEGRHRMDPHALHLWPRGDHILFALPNLDGSFNAVCTLPFEGHPSFATVREPEEVVDLFRTRFGDVLDLIPGLGEEFGHLPVSKFLTIRTSRWHHRGKVVLMGDACHTVVPFYGQGMNAALDDCFVLDACIGRHPDDWGAAFAEYQARRKPHTDTLAELSKRNFVELRDTARSPWVSARKQTSLWLNRLLPRWYVPIYTLVTHTTLPYRTCVERAALQDRRLRRCGFDVVVGSVAAGLAARGLWKSRFARPARAVAAARPAAGPAANEPPEPVAMAEDDDEALEPVLAGDDEGRGEAW